MKNMRTGYWRAPWEGLHREVQSPSLSRECFKVMTCPKQLSSAIRHRTLTGAFCMMSHLNTLQNSNLLFQFPQNSGVFNGSGGVANPGPSEKAPCSPLCALSSKPSCPQLLPGRGCLRTVLREMSCLCLSLVQGERSPWFPSAVGRASEGGWAGHLRPCRSVLAPVPGLHSILFEDASLIKANTVSVSTPHESVGKYKEYNS